MAESESLIDDDYLKEHYLKVYIEDAIAQMLATRQESNKSPTIKPCKFFREYFTSVHQGTHILFREFAFANATPYNRLCVLKAIMQIFKPFIYHEDKYNAKDFHSVLQLVWPDFQIQAVQNAFDFYDDDKKDDENCLKFLDFIKAMKASFCTGALNYEASIIDAQIEAKINEFSKITAENVDVPTNPNERDFLSNDDFISQKATWAALRILDGTEFKQMLNFNDSDSYTSDEPLSQEKSTSSASKDRSKSEKSQKKKGKKGVKKGEKKIVKKIEKKVDKKSEKVDKKEEKGAHAKEHIEKGVKKKKGISAAKPKARGRMGGKHLSNSLNVLQTGKTDVDGKLKRRQRSKSAVCIDRHLFSPKPWRYVLGKPSMSWEEYSRIALCNNE